MLIMKEEGNFLNLLQKGGFPQKRGVPTLEETVMCQSKCSERKYGSQYNYFWRKKRMGKKQGQRQTKYY